MKLATTGTIARLSIAAGAFIATFGVFHGMALAQTTNLPVTSQRWDGFSDDFNPYWWGDTQQVDWRRNYESSGSIMISGVAYSHYSPLIQLPEGKPIELIRSERSTSVTTTARSVVPSDYAEADSKASPSTKEDGPWTSKLARYAEVIDLDTLLLSSGRAVAEQVSDIADDYFSLKGRVGTWSAIDLVDDTNSSASAAATSVFEADYLVNDPVSFDLSGTLSGWGNVGLNFLVRNNRTGELVYKLKPNDLASGLSHGFAVAGEFMPGSYKFFVSADSDSSIKTYGEYEPGDMGEFSLSFSASPIGIPMLHIGSTARAAQVPEPATLFLLLSLWPVIIRRQRS
jgi:hypothetical protein